jgi:CHAT domain-containing protein/tetratricopeptide (TPR) repeat protein
MANGLECLRRRDLDGAQRWLRKVARSRDPGVLTDLGYLYQEMLEDADQAEACYRRAADGGSVRAMSNLGVLLKRRDDLEEAEFWLRKGAAAGDGEALNNLGNVLERRGNLEEAVACWRAAAEQSQVNAQCALALYLAFHGQREEARKWYLAALLACDDSVNPQLAFLHALLEQVASRLDPDDPVYRSLAGQRASVPRVDALMRFFEADDDDQAQAIAQTNLALAEPDALKVIDNLIARAHAPGHIRRLSERRGLLARLQAEGLPTPAEFELLLKELGRCPDHDHEGRVSLAREALRFVSPDSQPGRWVALNATLATGYTYRSAGEPAENFERAIAYSQAALKVVTQESEPRLWAGIQSDLGVAYSRRIAGDRADNLERAIACQTSALAAYSGQESPQQWARVHSILGDHYADRIAGDRAENLEESITHFQAALGVFTRESAPQDWAGAQLGLGRCYSLRLSGERADNLERSIAHSQAALDIFTREMAPKDWAGAQVNLGVAYFERMVGRRSDNLERAIACYEGALGVIRAESQARDWATAQMELGSAYAEHARGEQAEDLERAIACYTACLEVWTREGTPDEWARAQSNLGGAYTLRIEGERADNLERAIACLQAALDVHTREAAPRAWAGAQANLGAAYSHRIAGERDENVDRAVACCAAALEEYRALGDWHGVRLVACTRGLIRARRQEWVEAAAAFEQGVGAGELLYEIGVLGWSKRAQLAETTRLFELATMALVRAGQPGRAAVVAERSRARELGEALDRDRAAAAELAEADPEAYHALTAAAERLRTLAGVERQGQLPLAGIEESPYRARSGHDLRSEAEAARARFQAALARIQAQPGFERFLTSPDWDELARAVEPGCALVYLVPTELGTAAVVLHREPSGEVMAEAAVAAMTAEQLGAVLIQLEGGRPVGGYLLFQLGSFALHRKRAEFELVRALAALGPLAQVVDELVAPTSVHRLVIVAGGRLGLFPIAVCPWVDGAGERRYVADRRTVSYAQSARVLVHARQVARACSSGAPTVAVAAYSPDADESWTLVGRRFRGSPLPCAPVEARVVASSFPQGHPALIGPAATVDALLALAGAAQFVHFACHAGYDMHRPLASALELADGQLTLGALMDGQALAGVRLVMASACQTGIAGALELPDEVLGLPAGLLLAGAAGVVATLWPVDDLAAALLATRFYAELQPGTPPVDPARALARAQAWLAWLSTTELLGLLRRSDGAATPASPLGGLDPTLARDLTRWYEAAERSGVTSPFAHPSYWAGYVHIGA